MFSINTLKIKLIKKKMGTFCIKIKINNYDLLS